MRPRYKLLVKRVLPTIKEGYEERVHDMNQTTGTPRCPLAAQQQTESHPSADAQLHPQTQLSTQDYLLSICQLARPAFSHSEADWDAHSLGSAAARASRTRDQHTSLLSTPQQPQAVQGKFKDLLPRTKSSCTSEAEEVTRNSSGMEDSSNPESTAPGLCRTSAKPGPLVSDPLEDLYGQADSFLAAARLVRGGRREEGKDMGLQLSHPVPDSSIRCSAPHPSPSDPEGPRGPRHSEIHLKDPSGSRAPVQNSPPAQQSPSTIGALTHRLLLRARIDAAPGGGMGGCKQLMSQGISGCRKTGCERKTDKDRHAAEGRQTGELSDGARQTGLVIQTGEVSVWVSGCRNTWRQSRRIKAPLLPAIAEM